MLLKLWQNWKCTEWLWTDLEHLTIKNTLYILSIYPRDPNFRSLCSTTNVSQIGSVPNDLAQSDFQILSVKCTSYIHKVTTRETQTWGPLCPTTTEWPQNVLKHLAVKSTLHTLSTYPQGQKVCPFRSMASRFPDTKMSKIDKIGNAPNDLRLALNT